MSVIEKILEKVEHLPPFSHTALKLIDIGNNVDHSMQEVVKIIQSDPALAANILKTANSAAFRRENPVYDISTAVSLIGERHVIGIGLKFCAAGVYDVPLEGYDCPAGGLWGFSLSSAIASRQVAKLSYEPVSPSLAYTSGLLHDLGKIVISNFLKNEIDELKKILKSSENITFIEAEKILLGTDHCEVGCMVAEHWKLPEPLCIAMKYHHSPNEAEAIYKPLVFTVHAGDIVAMMGSSSVLMDSMCYGLSKDCEKYLNISGDKLERLIFEMQNEYDIVKTFLGD